MRVIYENTIKNHGENIEAFGGEMAIFFGEGAPDTLKDFCYTIDVKPVAETITPGQFFAIDEENFEILFVGETAQNNLQDLGHLTVVFTGDKEALLPGTIVVENKANPGMNVGTTIRILS